MDILTFSQRNHLRVRRDPAVTYSSPASSGQSAITALTCWRSASWLMPTTKSETTFSAVVSGVLLPLGFNLAKLATMRPCCCSGVTTKRKFVRQ